jgi:hypothetical protein
VCLGEANLVFVENDFQKRTSIIDLNSDWILPVLFVPSTIVLFEVDYCQLILICLEQSNYLRYLWLCGTKVHRQQPRQHHCNIMH